MKIELDLPDDFINLPFAEREEKVLIFLREVGKILNKTQDVASGEYIHCLLMATGLFAGFCIQDPKDAEPVKLEIVCPRIMKDMIETLGQNITQGIAQKQQRIRSLREATPQGQG